MQKKIVSGTFIVLRKVPYLESSLIISGLSPEYGRIDFLIKGERRISKKKSPEVDLFRVFNVEYAEKHSSLLNPLLMEYVKNYDRIAYYPERLTELSTTVNFLLRNEHYGVSCKLVYSALINHLERVIQKSHTSIMYIKLAYLFENGLLSHSLTSSENDGEIRAQAAVKMILAFAVGATDKLNLSLSQEYSSRLEKWIESLCASGDIFDSSSGIKQDKFTV